MMLVKFNGHLIKFTEPPKPPPGYTSNTFCAFCTFKGPLRFVNGCNSYRCDGCGTIMPMFRKSA